jgi:hypothetical protein
MVCRSFRPPLTALQPIKEALGQFVGRVEEELRRQESMAAQVMVFLITNRFSARQPFYTNSTTVELPYPIDVSPDPVEAGTRPREALYQPGVHDQAFGVMRLDLSPMSWVQADLFDTRDWSREPWLIRRSTRSTPNTARVRCASVNMMGNDPRGRRVRGSAARGRRRTGGDCQW